MSDDIEPISTGSDSTPVESSTAPSAPEASSYSQPESQPAQQSSPWDSFKQLPEFKGQDDRAIASRLYQSMQREQAASRALQQYQSVMPIAQEYLTNRPEFEKWRQSQAQAAQQVQAEPAKKGWWNPPEVRDSYKRYLTKDEHGREVIHPDAPLDARHALMEYQQYKADFANKFLTNPEDAIGPMIEERAMQKAQELIEKTFETRDNESFVAQFEEQNRDWLFDPETGSVSIAGLSFHKYVEEARSHGINGPKARAAYATAMTERDLLVQKYDLEQAQPQQAQMQRQVPAPEQPVQQLAPQMQPPAQQSRPDQAQQNMQYLRKEASRNPSRSAGTANNDPRQPKPKRTFEQMLLEEATAKSLI
jgi:hypothetical protein